MADEVTVCPIFSFVKIDDLFWLDELEHKLPYVRSMLPYAVDLNISRTFVKVVFVLEAVL